jgi:hypothetical protein
LIGGDKIAAGELAAAWGITGWPEGEARRAAHLSRMTVIAAIREAIQADWLSQENRRTPHGGNAVALYAVNWRRAERAERLRRKQT